MTAQTDPSDAPGGNRDIVVVVLACLPLLAAVLWRRRRQLWGCGCGRLPLKYSAIPEYWAHSGVKSLTAERSNSDFFDDMFPVPPVNREVLQVFLNETSTNPETTFRLVRAVRVENSALWMRYQQKAASIARRRGPCKFAGHGCPTTASALGEIEAWGGCDGGFVHELDGELCEAYLWHGTGPHVALRIVEEGFQVSTASRAGKRFGAGGYFSEDPAVADKYAGEGEGIYKGCYAMLLCRVLCGRQFHVTAYRDETATDRARGCDSTLAEPHGSHHREFIVFDSSQIYPEYALVYERQEVDFVCPTPMHSYWANEEAASPIGSLPAYWFHSKHGSQGGPFHDTHPDLQIKPVIQELLDVTWAEPGEPGLRVLKVLRVEDSELWGAYLAAKESVRERRGDCSKALEVRTLRALSRRELGRLSLDVNEVYLWHGSTPSRVIYIAEHGFPFSPGSPASSRTPTAALGNDSIHFTEYSSEADKQSSDDKDGYYRGYYAMLLCRVTLGAVQVLHDTDTLEHSRFDGGKAFDSIMGTTSDSMARREFILQGSCRSMYPEYALIYERKAVGPTAPSAQQVIISSERLGSQRELLMPV
eukprot:TRINITY_DN23687_c0_g1_i1.p1 TRINITY_DN23687_c0_g1~~TRINITY_DN23687_c0_g1_i1.p1  ORF type:complete len:590 (-),score=102.13 TRINITY_DN23687_c0_g1_i1:203-1972(-)